MDLIAHWSQLPPPLVHDVPPYNPHNGALFIGDGDVSLLTLPPEKSTVYTVGEERFIEQPILCIFGHYRVCYVQEKMATGKLALLLRESKFAAFFGLA